MDRRTSMSVASAVAYIKRMRGDDAFRQAGREFLKQEGFEFATEDFRKAQDAIYAAYDITPM